MLGKYKLLNNICAALHYWLGNSVAIFLINRRGEDYEFLVNFVSDRND